MADPGETRKSTRERIADLLPGLVAFVFGLIWFADSAPGERVFLAAALGFFLHVAAVLAYLFASYLVSRVAGHSDANYEDLALTGDRLTSMILVAVSVWILGQSWVAQKVDDIVECVEAQALDAPGRQAYDAGMIRWCAEEYGESDDFASDW